MKKLVLFHEIILGGIFLFGCSCFAFTTDERNIYSATVNNILNTSGEQYATFSEVDFNNDNVSELIISTLDEDGISTVDEVFTISNGMCISAGYFYGPNAYYETDTGEGIYAINTHQGIGVKNEIHMYGNVVSETSTGETIDWSTYSNENPIYQNKLLNFYDEQILPGSDQRYLTQEDIQFLDATGLELAKNEIYARRGRIFVTPYIDKYFRNQSWYVPSVSPEAFSDSVFNDYEAVNIALIADKESQSGSQQVSQQDSAKEFTTDELERLALLYYQSRYSAPAAITYVMEETTDMVGVGVWRESMAKPDGTGATPNAYYYVNRNGVGEDRIGKEYVDLSVNQDKLGGGSEASSGAEMITLGDGMIYEVTGYTSSPLVKLTDTCAIIDGSLFADGLPAKAIYGSLLEYSDVGYVADTSYIDNGLIDRFSSKGICFAINEIYARHGRIFNSQELSNYFNAWNWYAGTVSPESFSDSVFNQYEIANLQTLIDYQSWIGIYEPQ